MISTLVQFTVDIIFLTYAVTIAKITGSHVTGLVIISNLTSYYFPGNNVT